MNIVPFNLNNYNGLENSDQQLLHIEEAIERKRKMLIEKQKKLRFVSKQNIFLDAVQKDYEKYYTFILKQKQDQIKALEMLNEYISDLSVSGSLSKQNIEDSKHEQRRIVREIHSIKNNLNNIMENTEDVNVIIKEKI
jgi:signal transduction histidine kinase